LEEHGITVHFKHITTALLNATRLDSELNIICTYYIWDQCTIIPRKQTSLFIDSCTDYRKPEAEWYLCFIVRPYGHKQKLSFYMHFQCWLSRHVGRPKWKVRRCRSRFDLTLQRRGQYWHWNCGSFPHSLIRWLLSEAFHLYLRPQRVQINGVPSTEMVRRREPLLSGIWYGPTDVQSCSCSEASTSLSSSPVGNQSVLLNLNTNRYVLVWQSL
jgi:hypothetical protein